MIRAYAIPTPQMESLPNSIYSLLHDSILELTLLPIPDRYHKDPPNAHHWTTDWVWHNMIPQLSNTFRLGIDQTRFKVIEQQTEHGDFSYHEYSTHLRYEYKGIRDKSLLTGNQSILRLPPEFSPASSYHRLYRGFHQCSVINNLSTSSTKTLLIFGDSMTIPIIPILATAYKKIVSVDNRYNYNWRDIIKPTEANDIIFMFINDNWMHGVPIKWYNAPT